MKKFLTLLLAAAMTLSLAACGSKTDDNSGNNSQPASALELLNAVWANYSDDDKFPAAGGDFDEANMTEDAPGNFSVEDGDALDYSLSFPAADAGKLSDAASLTHMMNANTFTAGAFHVASSSDVDSVVSDLKDNIMNRQWMCGFPDKLVILTLGDYVISCYGAEDLVDQFSEKVTEAFADAAVVCDEAIALFDLLKGGEVYALFQRSLSLLLSACGAADLLCSAAAAEKRGAAARKSLFLCLGRAEIYAAYARLHRAGLWFRPAD